MQQRIRARTLQTCSSMCIVRSSSGADTKKINGRETPGIPIAYLGRHALK